MQQNDVFNHFWEFLRKTEGEFHIFEQRVPVDVQMEYFKFSNQLRRSCGHLEEDDIERCISELKNRQVSKEQKQLSLSILAISKQAKAYRILEQFAAEADAELSDWAYMALMESRITLETELSDERQVYIATGLGGEGRKLRFFVLLVAAASGKPFADYQRQVVERELRYAISRKNGVVERLDVRDRHVEMLMLIPVELDIRSTLEEVISECNQYGGFLSENMVVTNVKELGEDEIAKILNTHGDHQAGN